jgi:hypothetical protein
MSLQDYVNYIEESDATWDNIAYDIDDNGLYDNDNFFQKAFNAYYKEGQVLTMDEILGYGLQTCLHAFLDRRPCDMTSREFRQEYISTFAKAIEKDIDEHLMQTLMASGDSPPPPKKGYRPIRCYGV